MWKDYTRSEKADLIMRYVDYVELEYGLYNKIRLGEVFFRESVCKPCNELYDAGYLDRKDYGLIGNVITKLRISQYLPIEKASEIIFTLRQYYNVGYFEATFHYDDKVIFFNNFFDKKIVRIFPLEDYKKMDNVEKMELGIIYIKEGEETLIDDKADLFNTIPARTNCTIYEMDEELKQRKEETLKKIEKWKEHFNNKNDSIDVKSGDNVSQEQR